MKNNKAIVYIDGYCVVCHGLVQFIEERDRDNNFLYSTLQSSSAQNNCDILRLQKDGVDSVVLLDADDNVYYYSDAVIRIAELLGRPYSFLAFMKYIPKAIRDGAYCIFARMRKVFGRKESCALPPENLGQKILK